MKKHLLLIFFLLIQNANAQYLNGSVFEYDIASDNILEVYYNDLSVCEIDLEKQKIVNDYYWFEDGIIYEIDTDYEQIIGKYSKNEITVYDETFDLEKPVFSKMKLTKKNDSKYEIKISCYGNRITIEEKNLQVSDVIKLWLIMKGAERVIQRNKNADSIFEAIQIGG